MEDHHVAEVRALSDAYELALLENDVATMDAVFWDDPQVLRFGIAEIQYGFEQIAEWRRAAVPVPRSRVCVRRDVVRIADGVVVVDIVFRNGDDPMLGRQSQVWVRHPDGWRIVRAHVSMMPLTP